MPSVRIAAARRVWQSAVSVPVVSSAATIRAALEEMGWTFERRKSTKMYSKFTIILVVPKGAHVFQFVVTKGPPVTIETWGATVSAGAELTFLRVEGFGPEHAADVRRFLELYRKGVGKDPWRFTMGERSRAGYLLPEFGRARKAWASQGFDIKAKR